MRPSLLPLAGSPPPTLRSILGDIIANNNMLASPTDFTGLDYIMNGGIYHSAWTFTNSSITSPGGTRPDGSAIQKFTESGATGRHQMYAFDGSTLSPGVPSPNYVAWRCAFLLKPVERTRCVIFMGFSAGGGIDAGGGPQSNISVGFDLAGVQVFDRITTADSYWTFIDATIVPSVGGYLLCTIDAIFLGPLAPAHLGHYQPTIMLDNGSGLAARNISYTGDGTSGILLWWASLMPRGAWFINNQTFFDDFSSVSTIDINDTRVPGFNWYVHNLFPHGSVLDHGYITNPPSAPTPPTNISVASSLATLTAQAADPNPGWMSQLWSVCYTGDIGGPPTGYRGFTFQLPAFYEIKIGYDAAQYDASSSGGGGLAGTVALWTMSIEGLIGTASQFVEVDVLEAGEGSGAPAITAHIHEWNAPTGSALHYSTGGASGYTGRLFIPPVADTTPAKEAALAIPNNLYSALLLNAASNDGTHGMMMSFVNGLFWSWNQLWSSVDTGEPALLGGHTGVFSSIDNHNMTLFLNTCCTTVGTFHPVNLNINWVKVYQGPELPIDPASLTLSGSTITVVDPVIFAGVGDVVGSATGYWGLRAYTATSIGANAIRLRRDSDNTEQNFVTIAGGGLDIASINTFKGAANLFVTKLYDQSGGGNDMVQATAGNQPAFLVSGGSTSLPVITFSGTGQELAVASFGTTIAQPYTLSHVSNATTFGSRMDMLRAGSGGSLIGYQQTGANDAFVHAGSFVNATAADNAYHAVQCSVNGASTAIMVDGSDTTSLNPGSAALVASTGSLILSAASLGTAFKGKVEEVAAWSIAFNNTQRTNMNANQHAYWGF